jgi:hypothetical protein
LLNKSAVMKSDTRASTVKKTIRSKAKKADVAEKKVTSKKNRGEGKAVKSSTKSSRSVHSSPNKLQIKESKGKKANGKNRNIPKKVNEQAKTCPAPFAPTPKPSRVSINKNIVKRNLVKTSTPVKKP